MSESDARRLGAWFLGSLLVVEVMRFLFSYNGFVLMQVLGLRLGLPQPGTKASIGLVLLLIFGVGLIVTFALAFVAVRRWRAPQSLWLAAVTASALLLGSLATAVSAVWLVSDSAASVSNAYSRVVTGPPSVSAPMYVVALVVGYPLAAWLGCRLGASGFGSRRDSAAQDAAPRPHS